MKRIKSWALALAFSLSPLTLALAENASAITTPSSPAAPTKTPIRFGHSEVLESKILGEKRTLNIYLPPGYSENTKARYPVIYLLDGAVDEDYFHITTLVDFLATYQVIPDTIVVGIANVDRARDMTLPSSVPEEQNDPRTKHQGGGENFLRFIAEELKPYVESHYRSSGRSTLIGQSLGGLFATQVLLEKPQLFSDYLIVSPSLWWDKQSLLKSADAALKAHPLTTQKLYFSVAHEPEEMEQTLTELVATLKKHQPAGVQLNYQKFPDENHATSLHIAAYRGLQALYGKPAGQ